MDRVLAVVVLGLACLPLVSWLSRRSRVLAATAGLALLGAAFGFMTLLRPTGVPESRVGGRPIQVARGPDVSSTACRSCHPEQYASWDASYHQSMTQLPSPETIQAPWNLRLSQRWQAEDGSAELRTYELVRRGDEYWVRSDDPVFASPDGRVAGARPIALVTGSHHEQFFWYPSGDERELVQLPLAYSIRQQRWLPLGAVLLVPDQPPSDMVGGWNLVCIRCHSTHGEPRVESAVQRFVATHEDSRMDSRATEFGIACEACHGGGRAHVEANQNPLRRYVSHLTDGRDESIVNPAEIDPKRSTEVCGSCHSVHHLGHGTPEDLAEFNRTGFQYRPGDVLADTRLVATYEDRNHPAFEAVLKDDPLFFRNRFWPDGMVSTNGREYNGLLESPCFQRGDISCLSCHRMHQPADDPRSAAEWAEDQLDHRKLGDEACLQCHEAYRAEAALVSHTHHPAGSDGSRCYNCHMPNTTYGLLKHTRSHEIDVPTARTALDTRRPNACNLCHLDRTLAWSAEVLHDWYGMEAPALTDPDHHFVSFAALQALRGDAGLRAMMAWHMGWEPALEASGRDWSIPILAVLLEDPYAAVRHLAAKALRTRRGFEDFEYDYVAGRETFAERREAALGIWEREYPAVERLREKTVEGREQEAVLMDAEGRVRWERLERLLSQRDDRFVFRQE